MKNGKIDGDIQCNSSVLDGVELCFWRVDKSKVPGAVPSFKMLGTKEKWDTLDEHCIEYNAQIRVWYI